MTLQFIADWLAYVWMNGVRLTITEWAGSDCWSVYYGDVHVVDKCGPDAFDAAVKVAETVWTIM